MLYEYLDAFLVTLINCIKLELFDYNYITFTIPFCLINAQYFSTGIAQARIFTSASVSSACLIALPILPL